MFSVRLEDYEVDLGVFVGTSRDSSAKKSGKKDSHGFRGSEQDGLNLHIEGACGEIAFAKIMNFYYSGSVNTYKVGGDVGKIQVRTRSRHDYDLIVRNNDKDSDVFVLVTGSRPNYIVQGWILGRDAKIKQFVKNYGGRPPAYFVPKSYLKDLSDLYKKIVIEHLKEINSFDSVA